MDWSKNYGLPTYFFLEAGDKPHQKGPILDTQLDSSYF